MQRVRVDEPNFRKIVNLLFNKYNFYSKFVDQMLTKIIKMFSLINFEYVSILHQIFHPKNINISIKMKGGIDLLS